MDIEDILCELKKYPIDVIQKRVDYVLSLKIGWEIGPFYSDYKALYPPTRFDCYWYDKGYSFHRLTQGIVKIDNYFSDDHVVITGRYEKVGSL